MPELPEVETVARGLRATVLQRTVTDVRLTRPDRLFPSPEAVVAGLLDRRFVAVRRYGKHLFLDLDDGHTLACHLRMTGQLRVQPGTDPVQPHTHLLARLDDGSELRWRDVRRFGWLHLLSTAEAAALESMRRLGPDALEMPEVEFVGAVRGARRGMKALLLSQDIVCGLGNIYADEVLWRARIHPLQLSNGLSVARARRLYRAMQEVLAEAIAARGSSIDGEYVAVDGFRGEYQLRHAVYGRAGLPAPCCGRPVQRMVVASRSTHYCSKCQRRIGGHG
jgi:formamidopyrimidine-DNA glycosylase